MKSLSQENQDQQQANLQVPSPSESPSDSMRQDLEADLRALQKELESSHETIEALSSELTAKETQLNAILNSRAWRWVSRYGRMKMTYLAPAYQYFRRGHVNGSGQGQTDQHSKTTSEVFRIQTGNNRDGSITLLPSPQLQKPSSVTSECQTSLPCADVICFSIVDWNFRYQRPQQIMSQYAAHGHRVFYIRLADTLRAHERPRFRLSKLKENVYEVTLAAHRTPLINHEEVKGANKMAVLSALDELRHELRINEAISYVMSPSWASTAVEAKSRWGWHLTYDCMDEWTGFPGMGREVLRAEQKLVRECDLLVVTAQRLYDKWRHLGRSLVLARNGVDLEFYNERYQPNNLLKGTAHPIVGYFGAIADWFDLELMTY